MGAVASSAGEAATTTTTLGNTFCCLSPEISTVPYHQRALPEVYSDDLDWHWSCSTLSCHKRFSATLVARPKSSSMVGPGQADSCIHRGRSNQAHTQQDIIGIIDCLSVYPSVGCAINLSPTTCGFFPYFHRLCCSTNKWNLLIPR